MNRYAKYFPVIFLIPIIMLAWTWLGSDPYTGYIADPVQVGLDGGENIQVLGDEGFVSVTLLAKYSVEAVVKSKNHLSDYASQVSKYDLALAWGELNYKNIDDYISYGQGTRCYTYHWSEGLPVTPAYIATHSANTHLIHSNKDVLKKIKSISKGDHIKLEGYLVCVNFPYGPWRSSLTRNDTGNGACEIMYVTDVKKLD